MGDKPELLEEYRFYPQRKTHYWVVRGDMGAVHVSCTDMREGRLPHQEGRADYEMIYGGIECHYGRKPHHHKFCGRHDDCWAHEGGCWHDGSSLQFQEEFANEWGLQALDEHDHEPFFRLARQRYRTWIIEGEYADDSPNPQGKP